MNALAVALLATVLADGAAPAPAAPRVIAAYPEPGAAGVRPGEQTLKFVFSEPMAPGRMSVTGGDAGAFPEVVGTPEFSADGRTFTLRVRLKPSRTYVLGANGPNHKNFVGRSGTPATPYLLRFSTGPR